MIDFSKNIDPETGLMGYACWGELGRNDPEQDAPFHTCHYYYLMLLNSAWRSNKPRAAYELEATEKVKLFRHSKGVYRRFPTIGQNAQRDGKLNPTFGVSEHSYYNRPENLSRDNTLPIILLLGVLGEREEILAFIKRMVLRLSFFQNTYDTRGKRKVLPDLATPDHWGVILRAYIQARGMFDSNNPLYYILEIFVIGMYWWVLLVCDLFMVLSNLLTVMHSWYEPNHAPSELGHVCRTIQSELVMPTPLSKIAKWVYVYGRRRASSIFPDKIRHVGKRNYFKLWLFYTFVRVFPIIRSIEDRYWEESPIMSGLNYFFRGKYDAPFPEFCRPFVRKYLDRRA